MPATGLKQRFKSRNPDLVRIARLVQYEIGGWLADIGGRLSPRQRGRIAALRAARGLKLNIASGGAPHLGWTNIDVSKAADIRMDLRRDLPLSGDSAALIFCEHFCDHLGFPDAIARFLAECRRVLAPGGRARFVLHDAEGLMKAQLERDKTYFAVSEIEAGTMMESVNLIFRFNDFHQFMYDYETFAKLLREAGFASVQRCAYRHSEDPEIVLDYELPSREMMSMYVEALK